MLNKVPPHHEDLERAILGAMLIDNHCLTFAMSRLFPDVFYNDGRKKVFIAIQNLYDKNSRVDILTLIQQLRTNGALEDAGGPYQITKLTNDVVSAANIEVHINLVCEAYMKRESITLGAVLINESYDDTTDAFEIVQKADVGFQKIQERVLTGIQKDIAFYGQQVLEQHANTKLTGVLGEKTGLTALDRTMLGLVAPDFIVLAARPGAGKTALALSITNNTTIVGKIPCAWFSLEMDGTQLMRRLVSIDTQIDHKRIREGRTSKEEDFRIAESVEKISSSPLYIEDEPGMNVRSLKVRAHILKKKHGIKFIVVDYLQLMSGVETKGKSRENIVSEISRDLKNLARELSMPIIALSQLSRAVELRGDKMPQLSDLRESGSIEQDADEVLFLMRPEYYNMTEPIEIDGKDYDTNALCIADLAKNRHGPTKHMAFKFNGPCMHFTDHPSYYENIFPTKDDLPF